MQKTKYTYILILILLLATRSQIYGQDEPKCDRRSKIYNNYKSFIPHPDFPPLTLKLNFVFLQRDDGCCGMTKDNPEHIDVVNRVMDLLNSRFAKLKEPPADSKCYKGDDFVEDSKIRFHLNEIIEVKDEYAWNIDNGYPCPNDKGWYLNKIDTMLHNDPRYTNCINIYFPNSLEKYEAEINNTDTIKNFKKLPACSQLPTNKNLNRSSKLCMPNKYIKYLDLKYDVVVDSVRNKNLHTWDEVIYFWYWEPTATGIAHELGHSLGLMHSNEHHGTNRCGYTIMNQKNSSKRNYLPPTEIGKIHRNMRMTNIRNFLYEEVHSPIPWIIDSTVVMDIDYKVYEDVIIKSGSKLVVTCNLEMSPECQIIIEPGGVLDLSHGTITAAHGGTWKGIVTSEKKKCFRKKKTKPVVSIINPDNISGLK